VSFFFVCGKTIFLCRDKDCTLIYRILTSFMASFVYLEFLDIIKVISLSKLFFQYLWFLGTRLSLGKYFIKSDFWLSKLLST